MATSLFRPNFPGAEVLQQAADTASFIVGLDVHKKTVAICVVDPHQPEEPVFQRKRLSNVDLLPTLQTFPGKKVVVCEAAYGWFALRDALAALRDVTFVLLDTRKTSSWITSSGMKTDRIDAQVLCHVCLHGGIRSLAVHQPSREARECCKLVQYRHQLVRTRTRLTNQLKAIDRDYGANPFTGELPALVLTHTANLARTSDDFAQDVSIFFPIETVESSLRGKSVCMVERQSRGVPHSCVYMKTGPMPQLLCYTFQ
jgi:transposase